LTPDIGSVSKGVQRRLTESPIARAKFPHRFGPQSSTNVAPTSGAQKLMRLVDFLKYCNSVGKSFAVEIKVSPITDAQAAQLWNAIKDSRVQLRATTTRLPALNKIKKLDAADPKAQDQLRANHSWN
jgi:hypothetical protein